MTGNPTSQIHDFHRINCLVTPKKAVYTSSAVCFAVMVEHCML
jgi:hypothetical protein